MRILIVTFAWPPIGRVGALRPIGFAREWSRRGHEVHVLTGPGDRGGEYSADLIEDALASGAAVHRAPAPRMRVQTQAPRKAPFSTPRVPPRWRQILSQWKTFPDSFKSWIPEAITLGCNLLDGLEFDVLLSTSPPESVHYVARALARRGIPWVADFRDPWSDYLFARWDPVSKMVIDHIARGVLAPATAVTANTEGIAESVARVTRVAPLCVRNGFDHGGTGAVASPQVRALGYFGRIDPLLQHPERLWPAMRCVRAAGRPWEADFHLTPGGGGGASVSVPCDLIHDVRVCGTLPHATAVSRMQEMTANLVLCLEASGGERIVPGKLYEYMGAGRPILVCAPPSYEARQLVEKSGAGVGAWETEEIVAALTVLETFTPNQACLRTFSRERVAEEMLEVLERAKCARGLSGRF